MFILQMLTKNYEIGHKVVAIPELPNDDLLLQIGVGGRRWVGEEGGGVYSTGPRL